MPVVQTRSWIKAAVEWYLARCQAARAAGNTKQKSTYAVQHFPHQSRKRGRFGSKTKWTPPLPQFQLLTKYLSIQLANEIYVGKKEGHREAQKGCRPFVLCQWHFMYTETMTRAKIMSQSRSAIFKRTIRQAFHVAHIVHSHQSHRHTVLSWKTTTCKSLSASQAGVRSLMPSKNLCSAKPVMT